MSDDDEKDTLWEDMMNFDLDPNSKRAQKYHRPKILPPSRRRSPPRTKEQSMERKHSGKEYVENHKTNMLNNLGEKFSKTNLGGSLTNVSSLDITFSTLNTSQVQQRFNVQHNNELPIFRSRDEIVLKINEYPVILIVGQTGCGKSTQVPQYIYDNCKATQKFCNILVSQPRKIAAITIAHRVAEERRSKIGSEIGYQVGLHRQLDENSNSETKVLYCTTGVILQKLVHEKNMDAYSHIILDEVHERDIEIDFLLLVIRRLLAAKYSTTKIVLMSATMNLQQFSDFFKVPLEDGSIFYPPIIDLSKTRRTYEIKELYLDDLEKMNVLLDDIDYNLADISENLYDIGVRYVLLTLQSFENNKFSRYCTILVFLPGLYEINQFHEHLDTILKTNEDKSKSKLKYTPQICILHSSLSTEEQRSSFIPSDNPRVILSTNIAESSVTLPNVTHVLDYCLTKYQATAVGSQISSLVLDWASKNNCKQRAGRAGRNCEGTVVRFVHRDFYEKKMKEYPTPEMQRIGLESVVLKVKLLEMGSPLEILALALDPPDESSVIDAVLHLKELGALFRYNQLGEFQYEDGDLTYIGQVMADLPLDGRITRFIVIGYLLSVLDEAIIIGAGLNLKSIFTKTFRREIRDYTQKQNWAHGSQSDCIAILNAYTLWKTNYVDNHSTTNTASERNWCERQHLDMKNIREMNLLVNEIKSRLDRLSIKLLDRDQPTWEIADKIFILKIAIGGAFGTSNFFMPIENYKSGEREAFASIFNLDLFRTVYFKNMNREQVGEVYEGQLRDELKRFEVINDNTKLSCHFEYRRSEKVYVTFENDHELVESTKSNEFLVGKILPEVYRAVKLRQTQGKIYLNVMEIEKTLNYAIAHGLGKMKEGNYVKNVNYVKYPEFVVEPTMQTSKMYGFVTHVENCDKFYFRPVKAFAGAYGLADSCYEDIYEGIQKKIVSSKRISIADMSMPIEYGKLVVVPIKNSLQRGKFIANVTPYIVEIHLIDCGYSTSVPAQSVQVLKRAEDEEDLLKYPPRVIQCTLREIQPSSLKSREGKWTQEAIDLFKSIIDRKSKIYIYSVINDVVSVMLEANKDNWNEKLVKLGLAEFCEENYLSKIDYEQRKRHQRDETEPCTPAKEFEKKIDRSCKQKIIPAPPRKECRQKVALLGPYSPLEMELYGVSRYKQLHKVTIDRSSVNSILLNDDILNFHEKFYVAADISINNNGDRLTIRETTIMPNLPGLAVLISLIFSSNIELRRDPLKTRFVSVLSGLGFDKDKNQPYFGERDAALNIDIDLNEEDIEVVNHLRSCMSHMLKTKPQEQSADQKQPVDLNQGDKEHTLRKIKMLLLEILSKNRQSVVIEPPELPFNWSVDQQDSTYQACPQGFRAIFNSIGITPLLKKSDEEKKKLVQHAEDLKRAAKGLLRIQSCVCKLCNCVWDGTVELEIHLLSKKHMLRYEQLKSA